MNRKLLSGFLSAALLTGAACSVTSCKDTDEDIYAQITGQQNALQKDLQSQIDAINVKLGKCEENCKANFEAYFNDVIKPLIDGKLDKSVYDTFISQLPTQINQAIEDYLKNHNYLDKAAIEQLLTGKGYLDKTAMEALLVELGYKTETEILELIKNNAGSIDKDELNRLIQEYVNGLDLPTLDDIIAALTNPTTPAGSSLNKAINDAIADAIKDAVNTGGDINKAIADALKAANLDQYLTAAKMWLLINGALQSVKDAEGNVVFNKLEEMATQVILNKAAIASLQDDMNTLKSDVTKLNTWMATAKTQISTLETKVQTLENDVKKLQKQVGIINNRLDAAITSVLVQATYNPIFGAFSLPLDMQSNMLMCYWGQGNQAVTIPSARNAAEYDGETGKYTAAAIATLAQVGVNPVTIPSGYYMGTNANNAGDLFITVNPSNVNLKGAKFTLVNSLDQECGIKLAALDKADKELTFGFGYGRAAEDNGLWHAAASLDGNGPDINSVKIDIEPGLKSAFGEVIRSPRDRSDWINLAKVLYNQFNDLAPRYGVKAEYTYENLEGEEQKASVYSGYDIMATTFRPLSYSFLYGHAPLRQFPNIPELNFNFDDLADGFKVEFQIKPLEFPKVEFSLTEIEIDLSGVDIVAKVPKYEVIDRGEGADPRFELRQIPGQFDEVHVDDLESLTDAIERAINSSIIGWNKQISDMINSDIISQIETQVNSLVADLNRQVNDMIDDLMKQVGDKFNTQVGAKMGKLNNWINRANKVINQINRILENPNFYLQVMMMYENNDQFHRMSSNINVPTRFVLNGGNGVTLYPTSFSGEIVAPAYKKFVAVTNVWKKGDRSVSAQNGDATCLKLMKAADSTGRLGQLIDGSNRSCALMLADGCTGYVYEITYTGLDYHGNTSTDHFYAEVVSE